MEYSMYEELARQFNEQNGLDDVGPGKSETTDNQFEVFDEEVEELEDAYEDGDLAEIAEEAADVLVTVHILMDMMGINITEAYSLKMAYNLQKTGKRNKDGKIIDDTKNPKPDFETVLP